MSVSIAKAVEWSELDGEVHLDDDVNATEVLTAMRWFVADATRNSAEEILLCAKPQSFLVRPSSQPGQVH
jgi:hypothetical protein